VNRPNAQVVLIDTPGIHRAESALGRQMMDELGQALEGIDVLAIMIDAHAGLTKGDRMALERAAQFSGPVILLLNKIDLVAKAALLPLIDSLSKEGKFADIVPVSARTGDGVAVVLERLIGHLPEGQPYFPVDQFTDQPERFLAGEIVREKVMLVSKQEVPHAVGVLVESFEETDRLIRISATIQVERDGQKAILIGRGGATAKQIGTAARKELEHILGVKVFLELRVKVEPDWRDNPSRVRQFDWRRQLERMGEE
jgi:GTP-binding protein Era